MVCTVEGGGGLTWRLLAIGKATGEEGGGGSSGYKTVGGHPVAAGASNVESLGGGVNEGGGGWGKVGGGRTLQRAEGTPCNVQQGAWLGYGSVFSTHHCGQTTQQWAQA